MIDARQAMEHESTIGCEILYTSYKWHLQNWSVLSEHYEQGVQSPEFDVTDTTAKCQLVFDPKGVAHARALTHGYSVAYLLVKFLSSFEFYKLQITVSLIDGNMEKFRIHQSFIPKGSTKVWLQVSEKAITAGGYKVYFENDTLTLFFEIKHLTAVVESPIKTVGFSQASMEDDITDLYNDKDFCDINFLCKETGVTLPAHKLVLAARSPVFRAMFKSDMTEIATGIVTIEDIDDTLFGIFLCYMYTGKVDNIGDVANELLTVANKYQVLGLVDICEKYMAANVNDANVIDYLINAHQHSRAILEKKAIEYIKQNTHILAQAADDNVFSKFPILLKQIFRK